MMSRLDEAVQAYIKDKRMAPGYSGVEELHKALDSLSEEEWKYMNLVISSQEPAPYSFKFGLISDQLPRMGKQSAMIGLVAALLTYYETQSILLAVGAGSLSATLAWNYLTETAYQQKVNERSGQEERIRDLRQHNRFFKSPPRDSNMQIDLGRMRTNISEAVKYKLS